MPVWVFLAPDGLPGLNFPLRLFAVDEFAAFGLQIPFLDMLARLKHAVIVSGHGILDQIIRSSSAGGGDVQQLSASSRTILKLCGLCRLCALRF